MHPSGAGVDFQPAGGRGEESTAGRAHGVLVTKGKKGMQGKETVGVLPL